MPRKTSLRWNLSGFLNDETKKSSWPCKDVGGELSGLRRSSCKGPGVWMSVAFSEVMREGEGRDHRWETGFILITRGKVESFK